MGLGWLPDLILRCLCSKALDLKRVEEDEDKSNVQCLCIRVIKDADFYECSSKDGNQNKTPQDAVIVQQPVKRFIKRLQDSADIACQEEHDASFLLLKTIPSFKVHRKIQEGKHLEDYCVEILITVFYSRAHPLIITNPASSIRGRQNKDQKENPKHVRLFGSHRQSGRDCYRKFYWEFRAVLVVLSMRVEAGVLWFIYMLQVFKRVNFLGGQSMSYLSNNEPAGDLISGDLLAKKEKHDFKKKLVVKGLKEIFVDNQDAGLRSCKMEKKLEELIHLFEGISDRSNQKYHTPSIIHTGYRTEPTKNTIPQVSYTHRIKDRTNQKYHTPGIIHAQDIRQNQPKIPYTRFIHAQDIGQNQPKIPYTRFIHAQDIGQNEQKYPTLIHPNLVINSILDAKTTCTLNIRTLSLSGSPEELQTNWIVFHLTRAADEALSNGIFCSLIDELYLFSMRLNLSLQPLQNVDLYILISCSSALNCVYVSTLSSAGYQHLNQLHAMLSSEMQEGNLHKLHLRHIEIMFEIITKRKFNFLLFVDTKSKLEVCFIQEWNRCSSLRFWIVYIIDTKELDIRNINTYCEKLTESLDKLVYLKVIEWHLQNSMTLSKVF
ncbi:hypothetical protein KUTeg_021113 [Tegillarca granosa]|uniref:Uncharacterized protein n=1 Tax=Tegillarca granosa TaxID=220873 RepID=A0ABQ9EE53_TEGGR|nr:hypothetical protein KUTeg_021113 [Tegillarca granosa]